MIRYTCGGGTKTVCGTTADSRKTIRGPIEAAVLQYAVRPLPISIEHRKSQEIISRCEDLKVYEPRILPLDAAYDESRHCQ